MGKYVCALYFRHPIVITEVEWSVCYLKEKFIISSCGLITQGLIIQCSKLQDQSRLVQLVG
jgi:hypothetical protein